MATYFDSIGIRREPPCYRTHPPLKLGNGQEVYGGSCLSPMVTADVYVGLTWHMHPRLAYPWEEGHTTSVMYEIVDRRAPEDADSFHRLVEWTAGQIAVGKRVHVGCLGGHGRTGLVLAALVPYLEVHGDPIAYVRRRYCKRAVEAAEQVEFLVRHFGVPPAQPRSGPVTVPKRLPQRSSPDLMEEMAGWPDTDVGADLDLEESIVRPGFYSARRRRKVDTSG